MADERRPAGRRSSLTSRSLPCPRRAHSSSGLGRRPLTAVARVRIPYAPSYLAWLRGNRMVACVMCVRHARNRRRVRTPVRTWNPAASACEVRRCRRRSTTAGVARRHSSAPSSLACSRKPRFTRQEVVGSGLDEAPYLRAHPPAFVAQSVNGRGRIQDATLVTPLPTRALLLRRKESHHAQ